jgi:HD superfamily phosphodiesterase
MCLNNCPRQICKATLDLAWRTLPESILNHVIRTFLLARWVSEKEGSEWSQPNNFTLLYVACICHDLGTSDLYNGSQRFEVEGADAAKAHLLSMVYLKIRAIKCGSQSRYTLLQVLLSVSIRYPAWCDMES